MQAVYLRKHAEEVVIRCTRRHPGRSPGRRIASPLVTAPPTGVGSERKSRHKAYGNGCVCGIWNQSAWVRKEVTPQGVWKQPEKGTTTMITAVVRKELTPQGV